MDGPLQQAIEQLGQMLSRSTEPTVLVVDRFAGTGMPYFLRQERDPLASVLDGFEPTRGERLFRERGRVVAIGWNFD